MTASGANNSTTLRYPSGLNSQDTQVTFFMKNDNASLRRNVALILTDPGYTNFDAFSNNMWHANAPVGTFGSLEDIHNEIHDKTGGPNGHMGSLDVSAFDPVFWLHHANVDRLFAIWQALNPTKYVTAQQSEGNFTTEPGAVESATSPLKPFWDASGTAFWTGQNVQDTAQFGYAYPETCRSGRSLTAAAYQTAVRGYVNSWVRPGGHQRGDAVAHGAARRRAGRGDSRADRTPVAAPVVQITTPPPKLWRRPLRCRPCRNSPRGGCGDFSSPVPPLSAGASIWNPSTEEAVDGTDLSQPHFVRKAVVKAPHEAEAPAAAAAVAQEAPAATITGDN